MFDCFFVDGFVSPDFLESLCRVPGVLFFAG